MRFDRRNVRRVDGRLVFIADDGMMVEPSVEKLLILFGDAYQLAGQALIPPFDKAAALELLDILGDPTGAIVRRGLNTGG